MLDRLHHVVKVDRRLAYCEKLGLIWLRCLRLRGGVLRPLFEECEVILVGVAVGGGLKTRGGEIRRLGHAAAGVLVALAGNFAPASVVLRRAD